MSATVAERYLPNLFRWRNDSHCSFDFKPMDAVFSKHRNLKENSPCVEILKQFGNGDDFDKFWQCIKDQVPLYSIEEVKEFYRAPDPDNLEAVASTKRPQRRAWLDDRSISRRPKSGCVRKYHNPLTSIDLHKHLKVPRFADANIPNADRRLIYIADLDPHYLRVLTETATFHQVASLMDAVGKYLALQTSIRVKVPAVGFLIYELELHLPYFALRASPPPKDRPPNGEKGRPRRKWTDLSFLNIQSTPEFQHKGNYGIYEAQISVIVCGPDDWKWVAYAFVDTEFDDGDDLEEEEFPYQGFHRDPIVSNDSLDANFPIENPRLYFLRMLKTRTEQVLREWQYLVRRVECRIKEYIDQYSSTLSRHSGATGNRTEDLEETFYWIMQAMGLLRQLLAVLSETTKAWERFASSNGDIGYFSDFKLSADYLSAPQLLRAIKETWENLEDLEQKLLNLEQTCQNSAQALQLRLNLENNHAAEHSGLTQWFTISMITPFVLATGVFSMPQIPFELNVKSFSTTVFIIMFVLRLLFVAHNVMLYLSRYWKRVFEIVMTVRLDEVTNRLPIGKYFNMLARIRRRNFADRITDDVEMEAL